MNHLSRGCLGFTSSLLLFACALTALPAFAQNATKTEQWIHVRVESKDDNGETVRVNVPIEMAAKVLPAIHHEQLQGGKVHIGKGDLNDVDIRALLDAVRTAKDGEYVTVQGNDENVRVSKNAGYLYIHVQEKKHGEKQTKGASSKENKVEVKVPMKVVDALFSAGKDELDVVAALHALSSSGDTELVSVKDDENTVRVWIDSKNVSD
jgi:hypothetical protein